MNSAALNYPAIVIILEQSFCFDFLLGSGYKTLLHSLLNLNCTELVAHQRVQKIRLLKR